MLILQALAGKVRVVGIALQLCREAAARSALLFTEQPLGTSCTMEQGLRTFSVLHFSPEQSFIAQLQRIRGWKQQWTVQGNSTSIIALFADKSSENAGHCRAKLWLCN